MKLAFLLQTWCRGVDTFRLATDEWQNCCHSLMAEDVDVQGMKDVNARAPQDLGYDAP